MAKTRSRISPRTSVVVGLVTAFALLALAPRDAAAVDCSASPDFTICEDGDPCTSVDLCRAGVCEPGPGCNACERCDSGLGCVADVAPACLPAGSGMSAVTVKPRELAADSMLWTWRSPTGLPFSGFGDPTTSTSYALCLYDRSAGVDSIAVALEIPAGGVCKNHPCWTANDDGFRFRRITPNKIQLKLRAGDGKDGQIRLRVRRGWVRSAGPPYAQDPNVLIQLRTSDAGCWEATYSDSSRNLVSSFRAHSD